MCRISFLLIFILLNLSIWGQQKISGWETVFELSGYISTSSYDQTVQYFRKFEEKFPVVKMVSFGKSPQGRDLFCIIISKERSFTPETARATGKPVVMITSGIHSGEIEGKDASMLLLRDIVVTGEKKYVLDNITLLIVPVFNVDGHERKGKYNRINQNGPEEMGWRTTAQNLNLNRDWMKADTPEMQAMLKLYNGWLPDFFIDCHTSDGADYQYTVTISLEKYRNIYKETALWNKYTLLPYLEKGVNEQGFLISPYMWFKDDVPDSGLVEYPSPPRFSTGYAALQNRPALLIETHMMKPYKERVFSTKAVLNTTLQYIYENPEELIMLNAEAEMNTIVDLYNKKEYLPLLFKTSLSEKRFLYKGIEAVKDTSVISGSMKTVYTGKKYDKMIPYYDTADVMDSVLSSLSYFIPAEWSRLEEILHLHGIMTERMNADKEYKVTRYKFKNVKFAASSYEGRQTVEYGYDTYSEVVKIPKGTIVVPAKQRAIRVLVHLLQPESEDSFVRWGFMNPIFERKEYFEDYVMEKIAAQMLQDNEELRREFEQKLSSDEKFRESPYQRLNFFYERSPYFDKNYCVYPIMMVVN